MTPPYETHFLPPPKLRELVGRELEPGENLLWIGQPVPAFFVGASCFASLVGILATKISLLWLAAAVVKGYPLSFILCGVPFLLGGLATLCSPILVWRNLKNTIYAVTDRRAIIFAGAFFRTNGVSFWPDDLGKLQCREKNNGIGDLVFEGSERISEQGPGKIPANGFFNIPQVRKVERLLQGLAVQAAKEEEPESESLDERLPSFGALGPPPRHLPLSVRLYLRQYCTLAPVFGWFFAGFGFLFVFAAVSSWPEKWEILFGAGLLFGILGLSFPISSWRTGGKVIGFLQYGMLLEEDEDKSTLYDPVQPDEWFTRYGLPQGVHLDELTGRFWGNPLRCAIPLLAAAIVCGEIIAIIVMLILAI